MKMPYCTFDIDGVLAHTAEAVRLQVATELELDPEKVNELENVYQIEESFRPFGDEIVIKAKELVEHIYATSTDIYANALPDIHWLAAFRIVHDQIERGPSDYAGVFGCVTRRAPFFRQVTKGWLERQTGLQGLHVDFASKPISKAVFIPCDDDYGPGTKGTNFHLEDSAAEALDILKETRNPNLRVFLRDTNYNRDVTHERIIRVHTPQEFLTKLQELGND